jgi:hypothetical protein
VAHPSNHGSLGSPSDAEAGIQCRVKAASPGGIEVHLRDVGWLSETTLMRLGLLADIHEHVEELRAALAVLGRHGVDRFVILGDVFETGGRLEETIGLLRAAAAGGVWGNHDYGLCVQPAEPVHRRYGREVLDFMGGLRPRLEIEGCSFTHVEPWLDPSRLEDLWYFDGPPDTPEKLARSFAAAPGQVLFVGHFHRWLHGTPEGMTAWRGDRPVFLDRGSPHLVVVHAVAEGRCALFDTETNELEPFGG